MIGNPTPEGEGSWSLPLHFAEEGELERVPDALQEMNALGHGDGENGAAHGTKKITGRGNLIIGG